MSFRSYDALKTFDEVARRLSITAAAASLNQSKGAISYQIGKLEQDLGFLLFNRANARLSLTEHGRRLLHVSRSALRQIDQEISELRGASFGSVSVAMLTYFSSRWLSPRLTRYFEQHPGVSLRIDPISSIDMLDAVNADFAILWGTGSWPGREAELLLPCPAVPTANPELAARVEKIGLEEALRTLPLLGDSSGDAGWRAWHRAAGLPYRPGRTNLTIPDSNSRVQAVIDGQGLGLWDAMVQSEFDQGTLVAVSDVWLKAAGYYIVTPDTELRTAAEGLRQWLKQEAAMPESTPRS